MNLKKLILVSLTALLGTVSAMADGVKALRQVNATTAEVTFNDGHKLIVDFYGDNIFRLFRDDSGKGLRAPKSDPPAEILVSNPRKALGSFAVDGQTITTPRLRLSFSEDGLLRVEDLHSHRTVVSEAKAMEVSDRHSRLFLDCPDTAYYYGGGVQNGRFSHRGEAIEIVNTNSWTDGGVCSPAPFYWSTAGYGFMAYTFQPGEYDFGKTDRKVVELSHDTPYLDCFFMVDAEPTALLADYYQLTGRPVLLPKFGFYEGHLNAYNRDYWKETTEAGKGILFEDGKRYVESQKDNGGTKESLNGEKQNYQFSARAVVDRYARNDMPLGWVLPNDGYGAGYGQTETLDGNIQNLKSFGDYARQHGVEIGLWTQSNLHPIDTIPALLQRDIVKEVGEAGVRVLKTDVAWVGAGYSFGLNGIADVAQIMPRYGNNARPFIITLDGWAGTQRYGGVWTGDQTGGEWEYIRFHIPTYIGAGLSGMGNVTSDMDGIFGGKQPVMNTRDFQWKTFTPMQLNMDGWGSNPKYPQIMGEPYTSINRNYLKWKSQLLPYTYTFSHEASMDGKPLMRAMFLDYPSAFTHGSATRYQYMYGPWLLIAPIYQETAVDAQGNDRRDDIYLPEGRWYDYFSGETYEGGRIINGFDAPLWKLPVFVKAGAIIPMANASNNPSQIDRSQRIVEFYPEGESQFSLYDDDGITEEYLEGKSNRTLITSNLDTKGLLTLNVSPTIGSYDDGVKEKRTTFIINTSARPKNIKVMVDGKKHSLAEGPTGDWTWHYDEAPELNRYSTPGSQAEQQKVIKNPQIVISTGLVDSRHDNMTVQIKGFKALNQSTALQKTGKLATPMAREVESTAYSITPKWNFDGNADYYELRFQNQIYSTIRNPQYTFRDLKPETKYQFDIRSVNAAGATPWTTFDARTDSDPLRDALRGITATCTAPAMEGFETWHLFDFKEGGDIWHTNYYQKAVPFSLTLDLHSTALVKNLRYVARDNHGNGTILSTDVFVSKDKKNWEAIGEQNWARTSRSSDVNINREARYIRLDVKKAVGDFGSGAEIYVFKQPGSKVLIPGDVNQDGKIDENDLTSYMNYTGLKRGDSDFDGYVSKGDVNGNGLIDAYDISNVTTLLEGGAGDEPGKVSGAVSVAYGKKAYKAGDEVVLTVSGRDLKAVNALSLALPYDVKALRYEGVDAEAVSPMRNLTYDRHHTDGTQALYPTFVNVGRQETLNGTQELFRLRFRALKAFRPSAAPIHGMLVDRNLEVLEF